MCINFLLILVFGSLPLFLLMLLCVKVLRDKPAEQDVAFRLFFVTLLCLPCLAALLPRWTTVAMDFSARAGTAIDVTESAEEDVRSEIEKNIVAQRPETIRQDTVSMTFEPDFLPMNPRISETPAPDISMPTPVARSKTAEIRTVEPDPMETVLPIVQSPQIDETSSDEMRNPLRQHVANWIPPVFFMIWLIGLMRGVWLFLHSRSVYAEILREAEPLEKYSWVDLCRELETALQLKQPIEYRVSDTVDVPQVLGLWQPVVLLPKHLVDETPNRAVLIHELAHIRRRDIAWQMLMNVVCMIYWFQPLIRFFVTAMRTVREELCDDYVLRFGEKGSDYAATLLDLSSLVQRGHRLPERIGCAVTMPSQQNQIERRILSLLDPDRKRGPIPMKTKLIMITGMVTTALLCVAICPALESRSNDENPDETSTGTAMPDVPQATIVVDENRQSKTPETDGGYVTDLQSIGVQPVPAIHVGESTVPFRGAVQWEDGTPVVGADVTVLMPGNESLVLKSDANGRFLLWTCPTSRWNQSIRMIARCEKENGGETYIGFRKTDKEDKEYRIVLKPGRTLHGTVTGSSGTTPELFTVGSSEYGFTSVTGKSDFALVVPADELPERICAWADQEGFTYRIIPNDQNREESVNDPLYVEPDQPINLTLEGVAPLTIRAIDTDGTGLSGIEFEIWGIAGPPQMVDGELKTRSQFTWPQPIRTDENGIATIVSFPDWVNGSLTIRPVQFHDGPARYVRTKEFWPNIQGQPALFVQEFIKNVPVRGRVAYPDGNPVVGLELRAVGQGLTLNDRWNFTTTDDDGRYEFLLPPYQWYLMAAKPVDDWAFPMQDGFAIVPGEPVEDFDIVMEPVRDVTIQVLHVPGETPLADRKLRLAFQGRSDHDIERIGLNPVPEKFHLPIYRGMQANQFLELTRGEFTTDAEGRVTVPLGPGRYRYELLEREKDFFGVVGDFEIPQTSQQRDTIRIRVPNEEESLFSGKVLRKNSDGQTKPAVGVKVVHNDPPVGRPGKSDKDNRAGEGVQTDDNGEFSFTRVNKSMRVLAYDRKTKEAVHTNISAMQPTVTLELKPLVSVTGRIINLETGEPIAEALLEYRFRYEFEGDISCGRNWMNPTDTERMFYQTIMTDESGRFTIDGLLAGEKYDLHYDRATETNERFDYWQIGGFRTPQSTDGTPFDVGAIRVASVRPIGLRDVDPDSQRREAGNTGGIADLLRDARRERDAIYAWSRIVSYKNAILRLLEQNQMDAAKSVGTEMLELLVSTRKTLKERNIPYHEGRHDEELHAVAIAFEEKGENATAGVFRKHIEKLTEENLLQQRIFNCRPEDIDDVIRLIETQIEKELRQNDMLVSLFLNLHEIPVEEKLDRIRKLNRRDLLIRMLPRIASDYKGQGDLETAEALYSEAIELIKNLSTPEERRPYWSNVIQKIDRRGDMELLRQAALEMYEWNRNNKGFSREKILEIDLEKAKDVESDERQKAVGSIWGVLSGLSLYTTPMSYLAKVGETEKALEMADEVMAFRSVMTGEVLKISDTVVIGSLESTLGECAETYALCGEFEKARAVWIDLLGIMEEKKINQHDSFYWPMIINVRHDMFRDDMRTLCLEWAEAVKSYEDENRPDMEIYRRIDMIKSLAFVLARYGFVDDAQRILDELLESVAGEVTDARQLGYYKANIAQAYANARFPDQARTVAESIEDAEPREDTLKRLVAIWDW